MMRERKKKQKADEKRQRRLERKAAEEVAGPLDESAIGENESDDSVDQQVEDIDP